MTDNHNGHSAEVKMHVERDGSKLQVSHLGPDFLLLDEADDFEGPGQLILSVDGVTHSRDIQLQCGSTGTRKDNLIPVNGSLRIRPQIRRAPEQREPNPTDLLVRSSSQLLVTPKHAKAHQP